MENMISNNIMIAMGKYRQQATDYAAKISGLKEGNFAVVVNGNKLLDALNAVKNVMQNTSNRVDSVIRDIGKHIEELDETLQKRREILKSWRQHNDELGNKGPAAPVVKLSKKADRLILRAGIIEKELIQITETKRFFGQ